MDNENEMEIPKSCLFCLYGDFFSLDYGCYAGECKLSEDTINLQSHKIVYETGWLIESDLEDLATSCEKFQLLFW